MSGSAALTPGLMVIHGNQPEALRELLVAWVRRHPLAPLEAETVLVQSNGIAQWLKLALARDARDGGLGVAAGLRLALPAQFLWQAYRGVLGEDAVPEVSPLDKAPLAWRLMRVLPALLPQARFEPLRRFLADDGDGRRLFQLCEKLADLFDQYQVYRADWLADWAQGRDQLRRAGGGMQALAPGQAWQAALWRELLADIGEAGMAGSRAGVHRRFMAALEQGAPPPGGLPRRVCVFGVSSMPGQTFEALAAIARHSQVLLCVHNPCRYHWSDIVADKDLLRHEFKRHSRRLGSSADASGGDSHQHAQPLLAAWGKQGRDYIHLLDQYDEPDSYRGRLEPLAGGRIDLFDEPATGTLLGQLQSDILDLRPLAETRQTWPAVDARRDVSIRFHVAHSAQREVEILHDQLLARLQADAGLAPRDIIVMVPDINGYAPHIEAVFGQLDRADPRFIPYTLADQGRRGREPMLVALEYLLRLPEARLAASEILDLLDVGAVRRRLGLTDADVPLLRRWVLGAGVRWGLDGGQRERLALPAAEGVNSWRFGLRRMLLGFAVGEGQPYRDIEPYAEIGGLDAAVLGPLAQLLERIQSALDLLARPATPAEWAGRLGELTDLFFEPSNDAEALLRLQLQELLDQWLADCAAAGFAEPLPLAVAREHWLAAIDQGGLNQRFMAGAVSFCTLLPMRAIPFKVVCLLGMNDGDYPRQQPRVDFDLMQNDYRPGDRSRREDDRYLMLEALLSARQQLYVSWVGRSIRDNSERAPSVLVGQLRDHLAEGWRLADDDGADVANMADAAGHDGGARAGQGAGQNGAQSGAQNGTRPGEKLLAALTLQHPLQPFSPGYFPASPRAAANGVDGLYTYAHEWRVGGEALSQEPSQPLLPPWEPETALRLRDLADFLVHPVQAFFERRLKARLGREDAEPDDDEVFAVDGLLAWQVQNDVCERLRLWAETQAASDARPETLAAAIAGRVAEETRRLRREGRLPLAAFGELAGQALEKQLVPLLGAYTGLLRQWPGPPLDALDVRHEYIARPNGPAADGPAPGRPEPPEPLQDQGVAIVMEDVLTDVREWAEGGVRQHVRLQLLANRLHEGNRYKWHVLIRHWVMHLGLQLTARPGHTVLLSPSGTVVLPPLGADQARRHLDVLLDAWLQGMRRPLPVASRAALAWLEQAQARTRDAGGGSGTSAEERTPVRQRTNARKDERPDAGVDTGAREDEDPAIRAAARAYDGDFGQAGEVQRSAALARAYPSFGDMLATGEFPDWAWRLYGPLRAAVLGTRPPASEPGATPEASATLARWVREEGA